jgi:transposase-like protein
MTKLYMNTDRNEIHTTKFNINICELCGNNFRYKRIENRPVRYQCNPCFKLLHREHTIKQKLLDIEWLKYGRRYHRDYFEDD